MKKLPLLLVLLFSLGLGAPATFAGQGAEAAGEALCADGTCPVACPYGGSTEPSAHDCQASGGYVVGTPDCNDGGCPNMSTCVCCDWAE